MRERCHVSRRRAREYLQLLRLMVGKDKIAQQAIAYFRLESEDVTFLEGGKEIKKKTKKKKSYVWGFEFFFILAFVSLVFS